MEECLIRAILPPPAVALLHLAGILSMKRRIEEHYRCKSACQSAVLSAALLPLVPVLRENVCSDIDTVREPPGMTSFDGDLDRVSVKES